MRTWLAVGTAALLLGACGAERPPDPRAADRQSGAPSQAPQAPTQPTQPTQPTTEPADPAPTEAPTEAQAAPEPRRSFVTVPAIGLRDFPVVRYRGSPDDGPGTRLQDAGEMASPRGPRGGVGPGEVGNFLVTGHRLTGAAPLRRSPELRRGDRILVRSGGTVHTYEVRRTRWTSFRRPASLAAQRAPVPGRPGRVATRPMLTLSTCATPEDHAAGNYWADEFDNPEHRIDKIAVLVSSRPA
ncbi:class E sortase [Nocardioides solisilvae]|uniref:class E sortase n=1 Tax=Nocardioides solisilvae TaxID=1542435 RepID=UPI000D741704|nr:class E sortase [Nocardioides solisilvae]